MAITPRSFLLNPALMFIVCVVGLGLSSLLFLSGSTSSLSTARTSCLPSAQAESQWTERHWESHLHCMMNRDAGDEAYEASNRAVSFYPRSELLLNLRGFIAGRNGDHAVASYDFRLGQQVTGSPSGVFENNIAWTSLWQLDGLAPDRRQRVLLQSRSLYQQSMRKGWSCERIHTGMFVEHAIARTQAEQNGRLDPDVQSAVGRYLELYGQYAPCWKRVTIGDDLVVEEILSAAVVDQEMGYLAGVRKPTRHFKWFDAALDRADLLGVNVDSSYCDATLPDGQAAQSCEALLR